MPDISERIRNASELHSSWLPLELYAIIRSHRIKTIEAYCAEGMPHHQDGKKIIIDPIYADQWIMTEKGKGYDKPKKKKMTESTMINETEKILGR